MRNVAIIHFQPLEQYPPIQNLIRYLSDNNNNTSRIFIYTTCTDIPGIDTFKEPSGNIKIIRIGKAGYKLHPLKRYLNYFIFYSGCLWRLLKTRPGNILYYETLSSFPAIIYKIFIKRNTGLYIHYHEYTSPEEYRTGMRLNRYFHKLEKKNYPAACWVSHTNTLRMELFKKDIYPVKITCPFIMPNYPPSSWKKYAKPNIQKYPVEIVYAGAVSLSTMYMQEFANWVISQNGKIKWDIYSLNITDDAKLFFESLQTPLITLKQGINYNEMPEILSRYNAGVVLYKGHIPNYIYNAPNKIFEYLAVGLDVWLPTVMTGAVEYVTNDKYPKVIAIDFSQLADFDLDSTLDRKGLVNFENTFFCEYVFEPLRNKLLQAN